MFLRKAGLTLLPLLLGSSPSEVADHARVQGVTISCQTWGWEWGSDGFEAELEELRDLGVNWIAIHPYARIHGDGRVTWREIDSESPPPWLRRPIVEAHERGMAILVKPHLAYWGSPFRWRGEIDFPPAERARFHADYRRWIAELAAATRGADAFAVGTEIDRLTDDEEAWRELITEVRTITDARLTYAANWDTFARVPFWDHLDAVGVQAYFPISEETDPDTDALRRGWDEVLGGLRSLHERTGKPVVFTELGYNLSLDAAREPWSDAQARGAEVERARALQLRCWNVGLEVLDRERGWLRGAFLWKWFVGEPGRGDATFLVDTPWVRRTVKESWAR